MSETTGQSRPRIVFTPAAIDDLRRIGPSATPRVLKKLLVLESDPGAGHPLGDELTGFRKLVVGKNTWRFVYRVTGTAIEICEVWAIGLRGDGEVYSEAAARVAKSGIPELVSLAGVVERIGRLAGIDVRSKPPREPVPDWLADRLVETAGLSRHVVAAMDAGQALDAWTASCSRER
ncbi:MAG TPA: type II toxin-antitoxin system RelE/ParE family toxin [Acidimicrobiales bacterium]|nr:type II toxin-antitoxin system RelE/ParE family toxin [Acidimicrobiales bacterium]